MSLPALCKRAFTDSTRRFILLELYECGCHGVAPVEAQDGVRERHFDTCNEGGVGAELDAKAGAQPLRELIAPLRLLLNVERMGGCHHEGAVAGLREKPGTFGRRQPIEIINHSS